MKNRKVGWNLADKPIGEHPHKPIQTALSMGIKRLLALTLTLELRVQRLVGAIPERSVVVPQVLEVVNLLARKEKGDADGVYGRVAPALVEELARRVEVGEECVVGG